MAATASSSAVAEDRLDELSDLRDATRGHLERRRPLPAVRAGLEAPRTLDRDAWRADAAMGWIAVLVDEDRGGLGADLPALEVVAEELGRALHDGPFWGCALAAAALSRTDGASAGALLADLASGERTAAWCHAEAGDPWEPDAVGATLRRDGDGWRLTGVKRYVLDADLADALVVTAQGPDGLAQAIVDAGAPGVEVAVQPGLDLTRRLATVRFDGVAIGDDAVGPGEDGVTLALQVGALLAAADAVGAAERLMEMTVEYAKGRQTFGRVIGSYQAVKHQCADMLCRVTGARVLCVDAAAALERADAGGATAVTKAKALACAHCSEVAGTSLQLHGGIGFTWEHDLHLFLRRIKADEALFGEPALHFARLGAALA
jgi:alkylation response protein AidB-like acyl-CoA dehydrogenase